MANAQLLESYTRHADPQTETLPVSQSTPMLLLGALYKIEQAREAHLQLNDASRGFYIGRATAIIDALRDGLDLENNSITARHYEEFYSLIDECLQKAVVDDPDKWLLMAQDAVSRASDFWVLSDEAHYGLCGHA